MSTSPGIVQETAEILEEMRRIRVQPSRIERLWEIISCLGAQANASEIVPGIEHGISSKLNDRSRMGHGLNRVRSCLASVVKRNSTWSQNTEVLVAFGNGEESEQLSPRDQQLMEELLILGCQLQWAAPSENSVIRHLVDGMVHVLGAGAPIENAARYLSTESLLYAWRHLQAQRGRVGSCIPDSPEKQQVFQNATENLLNMARGRTLQDLCVVSILQAVKGDARKVWSLSQLPETLRELFHIPFQELYKKMKQ